MQPNPTSVNAYLPKKKHVYKYNLRDIKTVLKETGKIIFEREADSKLFADTWLLMLEEEKQRKIAENNLRKELLVLYHHCMKYKVHTYNAMCRFMEYKFSNFIECPDRIPTHNNFKEEDGSWFNKIIKKTGYYGESCGDLLKNNTKFGNHEKYILDNLKDEFCEWVDKHHNVLDKHFKQTWTDYSSMAYNNSADDL